MKNVSIKYKLFAIILIPIISLLLLTFYSTSNMSQMNDNLSERLYDQSLKVNSLVLNAERDFYQAMLSFEMIMLDKTSSMPMDQKKLESYNENIQQVKERVTLAQEIMNKDKESFEKIIESNSKTNAFQNYDEFFIAFEEWNELSDKIIELPLNINSLLTLQQEVKFDNAIENLEHIQIIMDEYANTQIVETEKLVSKAKNIMVIIGLIAFLLCAFLGYMFINKMSNNLKDLSIVAQKISEGNLMGNIEENTSKDEIGNLTRSMSKMLSNLKDLNIQINSSATEVASASEELFASADQSTKAAEQVVIITQKSAEGAESQLETVQEISSSIEQMSTDISQIAQNSLLMQEAADNATEATSKGTFRITEVVEEMKVIALTVEKASEIIKQLGMKTEQIEVVVRMITDIAEQTNLLALNAAIEAARAGEHGKGFAVVADEVRKLAEESKESAGNISNTIKDIQIEALNAVKSIEEGTGKVTTGLKHTEEVSELFTDINAAIHNVTSKVQEVSTSSQQMTMISQGIVSSIQGVKVVAEDFVRGNHESSAATEEQLATMEEVSSSSQTLSKLADHLQELASKYKLKE